MNDSANDTLKEQLSALMDGELSASESAFLIKRIGNDPDLRAMWQRQCMMRDVLRNEHPANLDPGLADRVRAELDAEPDLAVEDDVVPVSKSAAAWVRPLAGLAVAASVASVAVVSWQGMQTGVSTPAMTASLSRDDTTVSGPRSERPHELWVTQGLKPRLNAQNASLGNQRSERLDAYLLQHQEQSMMIGAPGWIPYSRIVGRESAPHGYSSHQQTYIVGGQ